MLFIIHMENTEKLILIMILNISESKEQQENNLLFKYQILVRIAQCAPVYDSIVQILVRIVQCAPEFEVRIKFWCALPNAH